MPRTQNNLLNFLGLNAQGDIGPVTMYRAEDGHLVIFPRTPPKKQLSEAQRQQLERYHAAAHAWRQLTPEDRAEWATTARRARLRAGGYALFVWHHTTGNALALETIKREAKIATLPGELP